MTILRIKQKEKNFLIIDKSCLNDKNLTFNARGLHSFLMGFKDDSTIKLEQLRKYTPQGRDALRGMINELKEAGYITVEKIQNQSTGRFTGIGYTIHEIPVLTKDSDEELSLENNPWLENPIMEFSGQFSNQKSPSSENPTSVNPTEENQGDIISIICNKYYKTAADSDLGNEDKQPDSEKNAAAVIFDKKVEPIKKPIFVFCNPEDAVIGDKLTPNQLSRIDFIVERITEKVSVSNKLELIDEIHCAILSKKQFTGCGNDFAKKLNAIRKVIERGDWQRPVEMLVEPKVNPISVEVDERAKYYNELQHFQKLSKLSKNNSFETIISDIKHKIASLEKGLTPDKQLQIALH